jgi:hypothetical protein
MGQDRQVRRRRSRIISRATNNTRDAAEQSAREALIEANMTGDVTPDCIQVTDSEGREVATVFLAQLLRG